MRVAVTGATGFVGRHLVARLLDKGHEVVAVIRGRDLPSELRGKVVSAKGSVDDIMIKYDMYKLAIYFFCQCISHQILD